MFFKRASRGEAISAAEWNRVTAELARQAAEISCLRTLLERTAAGDQGFDRMLRARVVARFGVDIDGTGPEPDVKYSIAIKDLNQTVTPVTPTYGRPLRASAGMIPRIRAAELDAVCWVVRRRAADGSPDTSEYWIDEQVAYAQCAPAPGAGNSPAALMQRRLEKGPLSAALGAFGGGTSSQGPSSGGADAPG